MFVFILYKIIKVLDVYNSYYEVSKINGLIKLSMFIPYIQDMLADCKFKAGLYGVVSLLENARCHYNFYYNYFLD